MWNNATENQIMYYLLNSFKWSIYIKEPCLFSLGYSIQMHLLKEFSKYYRILFIGIWLCRYKSYHIALKFKNTKSPVSVFSFKNLCVSVNDVYSVQYFQSDTGFDLCRSIIASDFYRIIIDKNLLVGCA